VKQNFICYSLCLHITYLYLGIVFTAGGSFSDTQSTLAGQALKAMFKLNKYSYKFTALSVKHKLELFDKLVVPILNYGSEVWGFHNGHAIECIHMQFCKRFLGVKTCTQTILFMVSLADVQCGTIECIILSNIGQKYYVTISVILKLYVTCYVKIF